MKDGPVPAQVHESALPAHWFARLASAKLSLPIIIGFLGFLAIVSAAATGVSYLVHHLARH